MRRNILVLEDEEATRGKIIKCIEEMDENVEIYQTNSAAEAWSIAMKHTIDVFLVDIVLDKKKKDDISGLIFAEKIREIEKYTFTPLIFITALTQHKFYAFTNIHSYGYLEKPYKSVELQRIMKKALAYITVREKEQKVYFKKKSVRFYAMEKEIVYIEGVMREVTIYTINEKIEIPRKSFKELMEELPKEKFIQCGRCVAVNRLMVERFDRSTKCLYLRKPYGSIKVGDRYLKRIKEEFGN